MNEVRQTIYQITTADLSEMIKSAVDAALVGYIITHKPDPEVKYLTSEEVCRLFKISVQTLYNWKLTGKIKGYRLGRTIRYLEPEIMAALQSEVQLKYSRIKRH